MPTPVSSVRQCLTEDAAAALDDAVSVARRRSHAQTTSLHAVSALLALPSSSLRDACGRARSHVCLPRLQFRALELSVGVSLDRLPSSKSVDDPPVSNSLMAAIKRSQAMQKRHPDCFPPQNQAGVKVELKHLILSILDDPVVSKVLGEAGFKSYDIKLAVLNPPSPLPALTLAGFHSRGGVEEDYRRMKEIMGRGRNPMLVGPCAGEALCGFLRCGGLSKVVCLRKDVLFGLGGGRRREEEVGLKLEELGRMAAGPSSSSSSSSTSCSGSGVVVNIGEVGELMGDGGGEEGDALLDYAVSRLSTLLLGGNHKGGRLCLVGAADNHKTYSRFQSRFPLIETEWDLQLLPITSFISSSSSARGRYPNSSLMGSFVPFGGFFSFPSHIGSPFGNIDEYRSNHQTLEKYDPYVTGIVKPGNPVSDVPSWGLSSWLQMVETDMDNGIGIKMNNEGRRSHPRTDMPPRGNEPIEQQPLSVLSIDRSSIIESSSGEGMCTVSGSRHVHPDLYNGDPSSKISKTDDSHHPDAPNNASSHHFLGLPSNSDHPYISGVVPVTTELHLGTIPASSYQTPASTTSSSCGNRWQLPSDPKSLCRQLMGKVGRQEEALRAISEMICLSGSRIRRSTPGAGFWIALLGPDRPAKKSIAAALAEVVFSAGLGLTSLDLSSLQRNSEVGILNPSSRGKTAVDYISEELKKCRGSVVFLENVGQGDLLVQSSLSHALRTGKFPDSHGREVDVGDLIFVVTVSTSKPGETKECEFTEERISRVEFRQLRMTMEARGDDKVGRKRKKAGSPELDLNLPVMEEEEGDECEMCEKWVRILKDEADMAVVMERVDLDSVAEDIWGEIEGGFRKSVGGRGAAVEVGEGAMGQMVAAAWLMRGGMGGVKDWIRSVLNRSFEEAGRRHGLSLGGCIFRLVQSEENLCVEDEDEDEDGVCETGRFLPRCILF